MTTVCAALLGSLLLSAPPRVGVIAVGEDPGAAGELQRALELRLGASRKLEVIGAADVSAVLPPAPARSGATRAVDPALVKEAAALLQEATDAYYQDRAAVALDRLAALAALQDRTQAFPVSERVRLYLWRTAVFLALKDDAQAEAEALSALTLNPDLRVDLNEFRPSVKDAVDRVRARGLRTVTIVVNGLPAGATLELDDRPVTPPVKASAGKHRLSARAPGRRDVVRTFDATADISIPMSLPLATDAASDATLFALANTAEPTKEQRAFAEGIGSKLRLDWLVIASASSPSEARALVLSANGKTAHAAPPSSAANLAAWIDQKLAGDAIVAATPAPTPRPVRTPRPVKPGGPTPFAIVAGGGLAWTGRSRNLEGKDGGGFETSFGGVGPRVTVDASMGSPFARVEAAWVNYGISTLDVTLPDGSSKSVDGGTTTIARLHGGWRQAFGSGGEPDARMSAYGSLGFSYETHTAKDVRDPATGDLGLLTGYTRTAVEIAGGGRVPVGPVAITGGIVLAPVSTWSEDPANTSGKDPAAGLGIGWGLGVAFAPMEKLTVSVDYAGATRSVAFKGTAQAPVDPELTDPTITENFHSLGVTAGYRF